MSEREVLLRFLSYTTGLFAIAWDGTKEVLEMVEKQHCFSARPQPRLAVQGLRQILEHMQPNMLYEVIDLLGIHFLAFLFQDKPIFVGPFVTKEWDDTKGEVCLAGVGLPASYLLPYKTYYCSYPLLEHSTAVRIVTGAITSLLPSVPPYIYRKVSGTGNHGEQQSKIYSDETLDFDNVVRHYELENQFISLVEQGQTAAALEIWERMGRIQIAEELSVHDLQSQIANATILRTLARKAAERGGVHPTAINAISLLYAQKMYTAKNRADLLKIMRDMIREFSDAVHNRQSDQYSPAVNRAIAYLKLHISQQIDMEKIAVSAKCGSNYLGRRFKRETGLSVAQYLAQERCRIAATLLIQTDLPVNDISSQVGYFDSNYFVKIFKKHIGETPTAYRNKFRR